MEEGESTIFTTNCTRDPSHVTYHTELSIPNFFSGGCQFEKKTKKIASFSAENWMRDSESRNMSRLLYVDHDAYTVWVKCQYYKCAYCVIPWFSGVEPVFRVAQFCPNDTLVK